MKSLSVHYSVKNGLFVSGICILIQGLFFLVCFFSQINAPVMSSTASHWEADISQLKNGFYFLSLGRPQGNCDILADSHLLETNKSEDPQFRKSLLLGTPFFVTEHFQPSKLIVHCDPQTSLGAPLSFRPLLTHYAVGQVLHLWQCIIQLILGPTISILLMMLVFTYTQLKNKVTKQNNAEKFHFNNIDQSLSYTKYIFFSLSAFAYTISLAQFPQMFFSPIDATELHMILRNVFTYSFLFLFALGLKQLLFFGHLHATLIFATVVVARYYDSWLFPLYQIQMALFILEAAYLLFYLLRLKMSYVSIQLLAFLSVTWLILQCLDMMSYSEFHLTDNFSPILIFVIIFRIGYSYFSERTSTERFAIASSRILEAIEGQDRIEDILIKIAKIVYTETRFVRVSAYLDAYCIGSSGKPRQTLLRVFEAGYTKDTSQDREIKNERDRGLWMFETLESGNLQLRKSATTGAHFIIVPIGRHACINLSDVNDREPHYIFESENLIRRLLPALRALDSKLINMGTQLGTNINQLRSALGDGEFQRNIGVMLADINDYSQFTARFGEAYSSFVRGTFFSLLIKTVNQWSVLQAITGDEVSFVSIPEFLQDDVTPKQAMMRTAYEVNKFLLTVGKHLCNEHGYPPIQMSIGMSFGPATIHCDPYQVHVTGSPMIESSRILHAASQNQTLVKASIIDEGNYPNVTFGEEFVIRNKKTVIAVRPVIIEETPAS